MSFTHFSYWYNNHLPTFKQNHNFYKLEWWCFFGVIYVMRIPQNLLYILLDFSRLSYKLICTTEKISPFPPLPEQRSLPNILYSCLTKEEPQNHSFPFGTAVRVGTTRTPPLPCSFSRRGA
jgi:hypothetical protein